MNPTQTGIAVALALVVVIAAFIFPSFSPFRTTTIQKQPTTMTEPITELQITDEIIGTGVTATSGDTVTVNYVGSFTNGAVFDSNQDATGFTFALGAGQVIKGWDDGVSGMKEGGKRKLIIPANLAYGAGGYGPIPPNSTLVFEVVLLKVQKSAK